MFDLTNFTFVPEPVSSGLVNLIHKSNNPDPFVSNDLIRDLWKSQYMYSSSDGNLIFSPYSLISALVMMLVGSSGNTQLQLVKALFGSDSVNGTFLSEKLNRFGHLNLRLIENNLESIQIGNFIYSQKGFSINPKYIQILSDLMKDSKIKSLDFIQNTTQTLETINLDVSQATHGTIPNLLTSLEKYKMLIVINTVHFQANWTSEFSVNLTKNGQFRVNSTKVVEATFMEQNNSTFDYYRDSKTGVKAVRLPYSTGDTSMVIILPPEGVPIRSFIRDQFNSQTLDSIFENFEEYELKPLIIPRFKLSLKHDLISTFRQIGITDTFDKRNADFSHMFDAKLPIAVSDVIQNAKIECNESGTVASAATSVLFYEYSSTEPCTAKFIADRPFLFTIVSHQAWNRDSVRQFLFVGVVEDPTVE